MHVIDDYLAAHTAFVDAMDELEAIAVLLRDLGNAMLRDPACVRFAETAAEADGPEAFRVDPRSWPAPAGIQAALDKVIAAKAQLVIQGEALLADRAPGIAGTATDAA